MILELLALASLLRVDPAGDAYGAGDLIPPSAAIYADLSPFDLLEVEVGGTETLTVSVRLAGIPDPGRLPNGLTLPVVDVYLDLADGGEELALPGVGMAMPDGHGWEVALRVHGDDAFVRLAADPEGPARPVAVEREGDVLRLITGLPVPDAIRDVQAVTGVYDPFSADGWRPIAVAPSPWAFSSETPAPPVVDLLADQDERQQASIRAYVLPTSRPDRGPVGWIVLMLGGLGVAAAGLWLRRRVPPAVGAAQDVTSDAGHVPTAVIGEPSTDAVQGPSSEADGGDAVANDGGRDEPTDDAADQAPDDAVAMAAAADADGDSDVDVDSEIEADGDSDSGGDSSGDTDGDTDRDPNAADTSPVDVPVYRIGRAGRGAPASPAVRRVEPLALDDLADGERVDPPDGERADPLEAERADPCELDDADRRSTP